MVHHQNLRKNNRRKNNMEIIKAITLTIVTFGIIYCLFIMYTTLKFFLFLKKNNQTKQDLEIKKQIKHEIQKRFNKDDHR